MYQSRVCRTRQDIRNADGDVYLLRYFLWKPTWLKKIGLDPKKFGRIYLHQFVRSDYDRHLHDHPWSFTSVMLRGSYREWADYRQLPHKERTKWWTMWTEWPLCYRDFKAPCIIRRGAGWRHKLELRDEPKPWTLVFVGPKVRDWGFLTDLMNNKWCWWRKYDYRNGVCEEQ
jgi:hypothetical protein